MSRQVSERIYLQKNVISNIIIIVYHLRLSAECFNIISIHASLWYYGQYGENINSPPDLICLVCVSGPMTITLRSPRALPLHMYAVVEGESEKHQMNRD